MIIAFDLDHTIFLSAWRDDMIPSCMETDEWDEYHAAGKDDKASRVMMELIFALHNAGHEMYAVTARPRKWLRQTYRMLHELGIKIDEDHILMRPHEDSNFKPSPEIKRGLLRDIVVDLLIEDRLDVVEAFEKLGVTTLQVRLT